MCDSNAAPASQMPCATITPHTLYFKAHYVFCLTTWRIFKNLAENIGFEPMLERFTFNRCVCLCFYDNFSQYFFLICTINLQRCFSISTVRVLLQYTFQHAETPLRLRFSLWFFRCYSNFNSVLFCSQMSAPSHI